MRIERIETAQVPPRWGLLRVVTSEGLEGYGEFTVEGQLGAAEAAVREMSEVFIGKDAADIKRLVRGHYDRSFYHGGAHYMSALGGIEMCLPKAIKDKDSHLNLKKGCQTLSGTNALGYVRMRKADPLGDLGRVQRQRQMLAAIAKEAASPLTVVSPARYWNLSTATADAVSIGEDTTFFEMAKMANAMRKVSGGQGFTLTVPVADPGASTPVGSAVLWDEEEAEAMFADVARGDTSDLEKYAK